MSGEWRVLRATPRQTRHSPLTTRHYLAALSLFLSTSVFPQLIENIRADLEVEPKWVVKLDTRGSFITNEPVTFAGFKLGREHAGRVQYGVGYSFLWSDVEFQRAVEGVGLVNARLRFGYALAYFEYAFYQKGPWELRIPVQAGIGGGSVVYDDPSGDTQRIESGTVFLYEPSMTVQFRFLKYFALGAGWGYRLAIRKAHLADGLTAPIYTFGLRVFFGDIVKDVQGGGSED